MDLYRDNGCGKVAPAISNSIDRSSPVRRIYLGADVERRLALIRAGTGLPLLAGVGDSGTRALPLHERLDGYMEIESSAVSSLSRMTFMSMGACSSEQLTLAKSLQSLALSSSRGKCARTARRNGASSHHSAPN
jgi:hypothetical protein